MSAFFIKKENNITLGNTYSNNEYEIALLKLVKYEYTTMFADPKIHTKIIYIVNNIMNETYLEYINENLYLHTDDGIEHVKLITTNDGIRHHTLKNVNNNITSKLYLDIPCNSFYGKLTLNDKSIEENQPLTKNFKNYIDNYIINYQY